MSLFITEMASLCATKNHPPPKDIIEFQIKLCIEAGTSTVVKVRVQFLVENPPYKEGQPPDILLKSALGAEKRPKIRVFSPRS
jgi:hypothetical protein